MSSQDKPMIVFESIRHELSKVKFDKLENTSDKYKIKVENVLKTKSLDEEGFVIRAQRILSFEPEGAFEVFVEFDIICKFNKESKEFYKGDLDEISKFIEKRKIEIFNNLEVGNLMSILISQISLSNSYKSIVVPPYIESTSQE
jgi:hypothetical protein